MAARLGKQARRGGGEGRGDQPTADVGAACMCEFGSPRLTLVLVRYVLLRVLLGCSARSLLLLVCCLDIDIDIDSTLQDWTNYRL